MNFLYAYRGWILGALAIVMLLLPGAPMTDRWLDEALPLSAAVFVVSVLLRVAARRTIGEHTRGFAHDADRLVTEGLYSKIRHPLYLSNTGVGYAFVVLHFGVDLLALPFVVALISFEVLLSKMEDRYLENRFGDEWRTWSAVTPAFLPRIILGKKMPAHLHPAASENPHPAETSGTLPVGKRRSRSFLESFRADASTWIWLVVGIALIMARKFVG